MPYAISSYGAAGGSPFQQYVDQQNQAYQQQQAQQRAQQQQAQQQNPAFGGQTPQLGGGFQQYGPQYGNPGTQSYTPQPYGGFQQQYNPLPNYNFNAPQTQTTNLPTGQAPSQDTINKVQGGMLIGGQTNGGPQRYFSGVESGYQPQYNPYMSAYNSLPIYGQFQYGSPAGGTGQFSYPTY